MDQVAVLTAPLLLALAIICVQEAWRMRNVHRGYRQLTLKGASNMSDEYDEKYTRPTGSSPEPLWKVKGLFVHPIKSCAPVELDVADVDAAGFLWDRKFAFAELVRPQTRLDASEADKKPIWTFRTQRQPGFEKLVLVRPEIWLPDAAAGKSSPQNGGFMVVKYPRVPAGPFAGLLKVLTWLGLLSSQKSFRVPLIPPQDHNYPREPVTIWRDSPSWLNYGVHVPKDFRTFLGAKNPLTLFRVDPASYREVHRCAPKKADLGYQSVVGFADAYPVHLLNIASVRDVAGKVKQAIPRFSARRFRANIVVSGPSAYDEDDWKQIKIGNHVFFCACHTVRCRLPNVDPDTAERHAVEPDKTLKSFRCIDDGDPLNACLGLQLVPAEGDTFEIHAGDEIQVLERGEHHYIKQ